MTRYNTQGTKFYRSAGGSPETFSQVTQLVAVGPVGQDRALIDITNLDSSAREYAKAIKDGKEITLKFQYDPANTGQSNLRTDKDAATSQRYRVSLPSSPAQTITFAAQCTGWEIDNVPIDGILGLTVMLKPTGDLTFA